MMLIESLRYLSQNNSGNYWIKIGLKNNQLCKLTLNILLYHISIVIWIIHIIYKHLLLMMHWLITDIALINIVVSFHRRGLRIVHLFTSLFTTTSTAAGYQNNQYQYEETWSNRHHQQEEWPLQWARFSGVNTGKIISICVFWVLGRLVWCEYNTTAYTFVYILEIRLKIFYWFNSFNKNKNILFGVW